MAKEIIQGSEIGQFLLLIKDTPLSEPESYHMDSGISLCEITNKINKRGAVYLNGSAVVDNDYVIKAGDIVEVVFAPNDAVSTGMIIAAIIAGLAGAALGYALFRPPKPDGDQQQDFQRITGMRNTERPYEPVGLVLGKRKLSPYYISRPYTLIEGDSEYFYALMSTGYGPCKIENFRIGEVPLDRFNHQIKVLDHFENKDVEAVYKAYSADISQEPINQLLTIDDPFTIRSIGAGSVEVMNDFLWPAGSFRIARSSGRTFEFSSTVRIDLEQDGVRHTVASVVPWDTNNGIRSTIIGTVTNIPSVGWRLWTSDDERINAGNIETYSIPVTVVPDSLYQGKVLISSVSSLSDVPDNVIVASEYHRSSDKKQKAKSVSYPVNPEHATTVYVKKQYPTQSQVNSFNPTAEIQYLNIKSKRPLSFEKFEKAIGKQRPRLRYDGAPSGGVETFRPTVIAIKLKADGQLNGALDNFFVDATSCVPVDKDADWRNWPSLDLEPSNNPADLYKWLLQGASNYSPLPPNKIDHTSLAQWRQRCIDEDWTISDYILNESTLLAELKNLAFVGRADFSYRDGKFGVVEKIKRTIPVQMFTTRNYANFQSARNYPEEVDGLKIEFDSAERDYEKDEATFIDPVKRDDESLQKGRFTRITLRGVDNYEQAYRLGRFFYYETFLQRETYTLTTDIEGLRCNRGDLVYIQNDFIQVGLGSGRIKSINGNIVVIDEQIELEDRVGQTLGLTLRDGEGNFFFETAVYNGQGEWDVSLPSSISVGDLVTYGIQGSEVLECIVREINYNEDLTINLTLVNAANDMYDFDGDPIPEYDSTITPRPVIDTPPAPIIYETASVDLDLGEVTLTILNTDTNRLNGLFYNVQYRYYAIGEDTAVTDWQTVATGLQQVEFSLNNLRQGNVYEFRVQARRGNSTFSGWSNVAAVVINFGSIPNPLEGLSFTHTQEGTLLRWLRIESPFFDLYEIRLNDNFGDEEDEANLVDTTKSTTFDLGYLTSGNTYYVAGKNTNGRYGDSSQIVVEPPVVNVVDNLRGNTTPSSTAFVEWDEPASLYGVRGYEVKRNLANTPVDESTAATLGFFDVTYINVSGNVSGTYTYWVRAVDNSGRRSDWTSVQVGLITNLDEINDVLIEPINIDISEIRGEVAQEVERIDLDIEAERERITQEVERLDTDIALDRSRLRTLETNSRTQIANIEDSNAEIIRSIADAAIRREQLRDKQRLNERLIDAVVEIDPDTGTIINKAFAYTDDSFNQAELLIDGVNAQIQAAVQRITLNEEEVEDLRAEFTLLPAQVTAIATSVSTNVVAEALSALQPAYVFNFFENAQGWVAVNGTLTDNIGSRIDVTLGDIENSDVEYDAEDNPAIRLDIERISGDGWVGDVIVEYSDQTTQTFNGMIEEVEGNIRILRNVDLRGISGYEGTVVRLRLVLGATTADEFIIRNITIGKVDAQTQEISDISARVAQAELDINANTGAINQRVTVTRYEGDQESGLLVTSSNFSQTLDADAGYGAIQGTVSQINSDGTIAKANAAGLFIDTYEGTFTAYVEQTDLTLGNFASAINQLNVDVSPQGALAQSITQLESSLDTERGRIDAQALAIQEIETDVDGNSSAISGLTTRVENVETESSASTQLLQQSELDAEGNTKATVLLEARIDDAENELDAQSQLILDARTDIDGNTSAVNSLTTRVTDVESEAAASTLLLSQSELDSEGNTKATIALESRVDDAESDISAQAGLILQAQNDIGDNTTAIGGLTTRVGDVETQSQATTDLLTSSEFDAQGNTIATGLLSARVTDNENEIDAQAGLLVQARTDIDGNTTAIGGITTRVTDVENQSAASANIIAESGLDENGNTKATIELAADITNIEENYATNTFVSTELDAARGSIRNQSLRITRLDSNQTDALIEQTNALADYAAYIAGQTDVRVNFARAVNELRTDVSPEGALAQSITDLEASVATESGRITATNTLLQQALVDIDGNAQSITVLDNRVGNAEGTLTAQGQLLIDAELDSDGNTKATVQLATNVGDLENSVNANTLLLQQSELDVEGNTKATTAIQSQVNDLENDYSATAQLILDSELDAEGNTKATAQIVSRIDDEETGLNALSGLITTVSDDVDGLVARAFLGVDVNGQVTGINIFGNEQESIITFQAGAVVFTDEQDNPAIFFDTTNSRYSFTGEIIADAGTFGGLLRGGSIAIGGTEQSPNFAVDTDGNISVKQGSIDLGSGKFTVDNAGNLKATGAEISGTITGSTFINVGANAIKYSDPNGFGVGGALIEWFGDKINGVTWNTGSGTPRPQGMSRENGRFWLDNIGQYSSPVNRTVFSGNISTLTGASITHRTVRGGCDVRVQLAPFFGTISNISSVNGSNHTLQIRILEQGTVIASRTIPVTLSSSLGGLYDAFTGQIEPFSGFADNSGRPYYTNRTYSVEFVLNLQVSYSTPTEPEMTSNGALIADEVQTL